LFTVGQVIAADNPDLSRSVAVAPLAENVVTAHNSIRDKVGVPRLAWSDELAQHAQQWADQLIASGDFKHRTDGSYGQNLFEISGTGASSSATEVVSAWAAESVDYQHETNSCKGVCGHYTQIVWRQTTSVGCGVARDTNREIWVCNYAPFGNVIGEKPY
jgi:uncharacterized protein YkwD